ncbi:MAG TPA: hypothetical protein VHD60_00400 [Candidatus Saccharimonadales bacterium]|nr:hypothetical protein [Candidatus Saccharimonadales bacterium]
MDRPQWKKPYMGSCISAVVFVAITAILVADTIKLALGSTSIGMLIGYVTAAVLFATFLSWSLVSAYQAWRPTWHRKVLRQPAVPWLLVVYLAAAIIGLMMLWFGNVVGTPGDTQNGTLVLILATEAMVPVIVVSGLRKE